MPIDQQQLNTGSFIPTTNIWDVSQLYSTDVTSPAFKELLIRLYQTVNNIALTINTRDAGFYMLNEFVNGQIFFPNPANSESDITTSQAQYRQAYRILINFGALPNAATKSVAHGLTISNQFSFTRIYGAASDQTDIAYIPIPYTSATAVIDNIELSVDGTNVTITTGADYSAYTICYVILEYLKL